MKEAKPVCVAQTKKAHCNLLPSSGIENAQVSTSILRNAGWTSDGTCILTSSEDNKLRTFVIPPDILSNEKVNGLEVYSQFAPGEPIYAYASYPWYDLSNPSSTLVLSSIRDHPLQLSNALINNTDVVASYPLVSPTTEIYHAPHSLAFTSSGTHFLAGSDSLIAIFDLNRNGEEPVERFPTIPSRRKKSKGGGVGMKGLVSSLDISTDNVLAAGTFTRCIGLYGREGLGDCIAVFSIAGQRHDGEEIDGSGVTQLIWSPCGRYLNVAERKSDGLMVYDVRVAGKLLCWLKGRKARTNQRLEVDCVKTADGYGIWAGGTDGFIRYWGNPGLREGTLEATYGWQGHQESVSSTAVHRSGSVVMSCSGERHPSGEFDLFDDNLFSSGNEGACNKYSLSECKNSLKDSSLRIWSLS